MATRRPPDATSGNVIRGQVERKSRKPPGAGGGLYYRVEVRPRSAFTAFRTHDVGRKGHVQRVAGRRSNGSWATVTWLVGKEDAHVERGRLVADSSAARKLISQFASPPTQIQADRFRAINRSHVPERSKPTAAQKRARNIRKAQAARRKHRASERGV